MPIKVNSDGFFDDQGNDRPPEINRILTIIDPEGNEHLIRTPQDLQRLLDRMTPEQKEQWKNNYRFAPVHNLMNNVYYVGQLRDV